MIPGSRSGIVRERLGGAVDVLERLGGAVDVKAGSYFLRPHDYLVDLVRGLEPEERHLIDNSHIYTFRDLFLSEFRSFPYQNIAGFRIDNAPNPANLGI